MGAKFFQKFGDNFKILRVKRVTEASSILAAGNIPYGIRSLFYHSFAHVGIHCTTSLC